MKVCNMISLSRLVFLVAHIAIASGLSAGLNVAIVIFNYFLDGLDGFVSRRFGSTQYGEFMDISIDRTVTLGYFAYHALHYRVSFYFFLLILIRDILVDYSSYFQMIDKKTKERHKISGDPHYWVYSSRISKLVNGLLQMAIAGWGFVSKVPLSPQLLFLLVSYIRAVPALNKTARLL